MGSARWTAIVLQQLGYLAASQQMYDCAARLLGKVEALCEDMRSPVAPRDRAEYDATIQQAREALGGELFVTLWNQGRHASLDLLDVNALNPLLDRFVSGNDKNTVEPPAV